MTPYTRRFLDQMTDEDAYWAGYVRADGSLSQSAPGAVVLRFTQVHEEPVRKLADRLGKNVYKLTPKSSPFPGSKDYYVVQGSCLLAKIYLELGVKSDNLHEVFLYNPHFWRGMIDGDGTLVVKPYPTIQLVGTETDMQRFADFLAKVAGEHRLSPKKHGSIFRLRTSCNRAIYAVNAIYGSGKSELPYKESLAQSIMALSPSTHFNAARAVST